MSSRGRRALRSGTRESARDFAAVRRPLRQGLRKCPLALERAAGLSSCTDVDPVASRCRFPAEGDYDPASANLAAIGSQRARVSVSGTPTVPC